MYSYKLVSQKLIYILKNNLNKIVKIFLKIIAAVFALLACGSSAVSDADKNAETTKYVNDIDVYGNYQYDYATTNGINAGEQGTGGSDAKGAYSYYSPEGVYVQLAYTANEAGFQASGSHLPTPPPIPYHILKSLEYIRAHPPKSEDFQIAYVQFV